MPRVTNKKADDYNRRAEKYREEWREKQAKRESGELVRGPQVVSVRNSNSYPVVIKIAGEGRRLSPGEVIAGLEKSSLSEHRKQGILLF
jgi:hypothetical protein